MAIGPSNSKDVSIKYLARHLEFDFDVCIATYQGVVHDKFKVSTQAYLPNDMFLEVSLKVRSAYIAAGWACATLTKKDGFITLTLERT